MTNFKFLHAADVHLDSPLLGLSRYEGVPHDEIRGATRAAFDNLVRYAIEQSVDFVIISGDLFDGDWKDMSTGLYFARAVGLLDQASIPVFLLAGNHDAASVLSRTVPWPPNVRQFTHKKPETHHLESLGVAIHGQSFANAAVVDNLAAQYPVPIEHAFNIGVLHTALSGRPGHAGYAPCSVEDLRSRGYDYWALGHVHAFERVSVDPHIVFPGNLQGRTIRETGAKGAVIVEVSDRQVTSIERVELDVVRWARVLVDCSGAEVDELTAMIRSALASVLAEVAGRPLIVRLVLAGKTAHAGAIRDGIARMRDDVRAIAAAVSPDLWLEKIVDELEDAAGGPASLVVGEDFAALVGAAPDDAALARLVEEDLKPFLDAVRGDLNGADDPLRVGAEGGDWASIIRCAADVLRHRLQGAG
jgi:exonuclease SbcD